MKRIKNTFDMIVNVCLAFASKSRSYYFMSRRNRKIWFYTSFLVLGARGCDYIYIY